MRKRYRKFSELSDIDQKIRHIVSEEMDDKTQLTIELFNEFEAFGHHETWAQGYKITDGNIIVVAEYLDDALNKYEFEKKRGKFE